MTPLAENEDVKITHYFDVVYALIAFGKGLTEAASNVEMARRRERRKSSPEPKQKPLDLSGSNFKRI